LLGVRGVVLLCVVMVSVLILTYLMYAPQAKAAYPCSGKHVYPSQNLAAVAGNSPKGTTFCVHDGTYNVSTPVRVEENDKFIGLYNDTSRPKVATSQAHYVFNTVGGDGALIKGLTVSGAVGGNYCEPNCGRAIGGGGSNLTVYNVRLTGNKNQGIGGVGPGLRVENSEIDHNGSYSFSLQDGGSSVTAGIKSAKSMTVLNSYIHDNYWSGVWCDNSCGSFVVQNSTINGNGKAGIHDEISNGPAVFSGNTIKGNGRLGDAAGRHAGILIVSSAHVDAHHNTFGGTTQSFGSKVGFGVQVVKDGRSPGVSDVRIHDNIQNGDAIVACTLSGVSCWNNK
jgi:hypothetical protein